MTSLNYKISIIGPRKSGKSNFIRYLLGEDPKKENSSIIQSEIHYVHFKTSCGKQIAFELWEHCPNTKQDFFDGAILLFDLTSNESLHTSSHIGLSFQKILPHAPIIICGNKCDLQKQKLQNYNLMGRFISGCPYYETSAKTGKNIENVLLHLARTLTRNIDLNFTQQITDLNQQTVDLTNSRTEVSWVTLPGGGKIKITYEYYFPQN